MDRFLAEIDRLRRKAAAEAAGEQPPPRTAAPPKAQPVARAATPVTPAGVRAQDKGRGRDPDREKERRRERDQDREEDRNQDRSQERPKARPVAARAEPVPPPAPVSSRRIEQPGAPLAAPVTPGTLSPASRVEDLPVAPAVTGATRGTGAPTATRVTRIAASPRPVAKTDFAKNLTALLGSGQGAAMAVVLTEVFGPPKSRRGGTGETPPEPAAS
jgi:hypothetical protein